MTSCNEIEYRIIVGYQLSNYFSAHKIQSIKIGIVLLIIKQILNTTNFLELGQSKDSIVQLFNYIRKLSKQSIDQPVYWYSCTIIVISVTFEFEFLETIFKTPYSKKNVSICKNCYFQHSTHFVPHSELFCATQSTSASYTLLSRYASVCFCVHIVRMLFYSDHSYSGILHIPSGDKS